MRSSCRENDSFRPKRWLRKSGRRCEPARDQDFVIMARTDARAVEGFDQAVARALKYVEAGADAIFPGSAADPGRIQGFCAEGECAVAGEHDGIWKKPAA